MYRPQFNSYDLFDALPVIETDDADD